MLPDITPLILTFNEAPNIGRVLERLTWAKRIVVLDSFSTEETLDIVKSFSLSALARDLSEFSLPGFQLLTLREVKTLPSSRRRVSFRP